MVKPMRRNDTNRWGVILAVVLLVFVVVAGAWSFSVARNSRQRTAELAHQIAPASLLLLNVDRDAHQAQLHLERVLAIEAAGGDPTVERAEHADNAAQIYGQRWVTFRNLSSQLADQLSGAEQHADMFEADRAIWFASANKVLGMAPGPDRQVALADTQAKFDTMRTHLDILEEEFLEPQIAAVGDAVVDNIDMLVVMIATAAGIIALLAGGVTGTSVRALRVQAREHARREDALVESTTRQHFESQVRRALEMSNTEAAAVSIVARATHEALGDVAVSELLLADSSRAHLRSAHRRSPSGAPGCGVRTPEECRAVSTGSAQLFGDSNSLDACPFLAERGDDTLSAVCVPVSINGRSTGVLHAARPGTSDFTDTDQAQLSTIANHTGIRLSVLRNQELASHQASTDPLTGLANRRALESVVQRLRHECSTLAVAMVDLDHFKALNDTHGHETGDRALRVFADAARDVTMQYDSVVARWGGEEFVIVLADADLERGVALSEELRDALAVRLIDAATPGFTVSVGVTVGNSDAPFHELLASADSALYAAKQSGRDRVVTHVN